MCVCVCVCVCVLCVCVCLFVCVCVCVCFWSAVHFQKYCLLFSTLCISQTTLLTTMYSCTFFDVVMLAGRGWGGGYSIGVDVFGSFSL